MAIFDVSERADALLPRHVLRELDVLFEGNYLLVGALARDLVAHLLGGVDLGRMTRDVDICIAVEDGDELRRHLDRMSPPAGQANRRNVLDWPVDVLPYGAIAPGGMFEDDGLLTDVTGMAEADRTADTFDLGGGQVVRCPSLASMIVLKIVAWGPKSRFTRSGRCSRGMEPNS